MPQPVRVRTRMVGTVGCVPAAQPGDSHPPRRSSRPPGVGAHSTAPGLGTRCGPAITGGSGAHAHLLRPCPRQHAEHAGGSGGGRHGHVHGRCAVVGAERLGRAVLQCLCGRALAGTPGSARWPAPGQPPPHAAHPHRHWRGRLRVLRGVELDAAVRGAGDAGGAAVHPAVGGGDGGQPELRRHAGALPLDQRCHPGAADRPLHLAIPAARRPLPPAAAGDRAGLAGLRAGQGARCVAHRHPGHRAEPGPARRDRRAPPHPRGHAHHGHARRTDRTGQPALLRPGAAPGHRQCAAQRDGIRAGRAGPQRIQARQRPAGPRRGRPAAAVGGAAAA